MKKMISIILMFVLVLDVLPSIVFAEEALTDDTNTYSISITDNKITIIGFGPTHYVNVPIELMIPATLNYDGIAYPVTAIGSYAFYKNYNIRSLTVEQGTIPLVIEEGAFHDCISMESLILPSNVTTLSAKAFKSCHALTTVSMAEGIISVGSEAFYGCSKVENFLLPSTLESLSLMAFNGCTGGIRTITILSDLELNTNVTFDSSTKFFVRTEQQKTWLTTMRTNLPITADRITVMSAPAVIFDQQCSGRDVLYASADDGLLTLPNLPERRQFVFGGWMDRNGAVYNVEECYSVSGDIDILTAVWNFCPSSSRVTNSDIKEAINYPQQLDAVLHKDDSPISSGYDTTVTVNVDEDTVWKQVEKRNLGVQYEATGNGLLMNSVTHELSDEYREAANEMFDIPLARWGGGSANYVNLMNNLGPYDQRKESTYINDLAKVAYPEETDGTYDIGKQAKDKVDYGPVEFVNSVLEINPNAEFIFVISLYTMTTQETSNFIRLLVDPSERWASLRKEYGFSTGETPIRLVGLELGNECWGNGVRSALSDAKKNDPNLTDEEIKEKATETIFSIAKRYADVSEPYVETMKMVREELNADYDIITIAPAEQDFWGLKWNRAVMRYMRSFDDGVYAIHTYDYTINALSLNTLLDNITGIYREEVGYDSSPRFIFTEHAIWSDNWRKTSLYSALAELVAINTMMLRNDVYGANYHTMTSYGSWAMLQDAGGRLMPSGNAKAYGAYLDGIGDRIVKATYDTLQYPPQNGTSYSLAEQNYAPDKSASILVTADGARTLKVAAVANSLDEAKETTIYFNFKHSYTLTSAKVLTAPNMFSYIADAASTDVFKLEETLAAPQENCTQYKLPPQSAVFLTFEMIDDGEIADEAVDTGKHLPDKALYRDLLDGVSADSEGVYELDAPTPIDRVLLKNNMSGSDIKVRARNMDAEWEVITNGTLARDKDSYFPSAEQYYDAIQLDGVDKNSVAVLTELRTDGSYNDIPKSDTFMIYPRIGGIDCLQEASYSGRNVSAFGSGLFHRGASSAGKVTAEYSGDTISAELYFAEEDEYFSMDDDFSEYDSDFTLSTYQSGSETYVGDNGVNGGLTGDAVTFGNGNWISSIPSTGHSFGVVDSDTGGETGCYMYMNGKAMMLGDMKDDKPMAEYPSVLYNGDTAKLGNAFRLRFNLARTEAKVYFGVKFMIHHDGQNFYALFFDAYNGYQTGPLWSLWKVTDGTAQKLRSGVSYDKQSGTNFTVDLIYDHGEIRWSTVNMNGGAVIPSRCGSYIDGNPFLAEQSTFGFCCKAESVNSARFFGIIVDDVRAVGMDTAHANYDAGFIVDYIDGTFSEYEGDLAFAIDENDTATVTGFQTNRTPTTEYDLVIPRTVCIGGKRYVVTAVGDHAFAGTSTAKNTLLRSITFPDTLESIGESAFDYCTQPISLMFPSSLKNIGKFAFRGLSNARSIGALPEGVTLGVQCFDSINLVNQNKENEEFSTVVPGSAVLQASPFKSGRMNRAVFGEGISNLTGETCYQNKLLKELVLPSTCKSIFASDLNGTNNITDIYILSEEFHFNSSTIANMGCESTRVTFHVTSETVAEEVRKLTVNVTDANKKTDTVEIVVDVMEFPTTVLCTTPENYIVLTNSTMTLPESSFEGFVLTGYTDGRCIYRPGDVYSADMSRVLISLWERDESKYNIISDYEDRLEIIAPNTLKATCIVGYYNKAGVLQSLLVKNLDLEAKAPALISLKPDTAKDLLPDGGTVKIFLMDNIKNLIPICEKTEKNVL